ncbi:hypothetical protein B9479_001400 [Cryptococcus floricola]|uniref:glucan 1,4-alpha-glucosidase n=1 Tax=Cryptococcus floricola TaxID=2591691 RepID=A0A5D3B6F1_9TREE|nr:hypothetical protein B9479_001400 [Cryptococcus floricola]
MSADDAGHDRLDSGPLQEKRSTDSARPPSASYRSHKKTLSGRNGLPAPLPDSMSTSKVAIIFATALLGAAWLYIDPLARWRSSTRFATHVTDDWVNDVQLERLLEKRILENIGPVVGAGSGLVIASPSVGQGAEPNYYYTWTRDSALTFSTLIPNFYSSNNTDSPTDGPDILLREPLFRAYVESQSKLQAVPNPSGDLKTGGLNEPKFNVNGSAFNGNWGRPQRDGPALRAITVLKYANFLLDRRYPADIQYLRQWIYNPKRLKSVGPVLKNDLEEVAHGWFKPGFDIWEEVDGYHLFNLLVSRRALWEGQALASRLGDKEAASYYGLQAQRIGDSLSQFWEGEKLYWKSSLASLNPGDTVGLNFPQRGWHDCSLPLSIIHARSETHLPGNLTSPSFAPSDADVLASLRAFALSFEGLYRVNGQKKWTESWNLGRYREDVYDGQGTSKANPWYLCTYSFAHSLHLAYKDLSERGSITVTQSSREFWGDVIQSSDVKAGDEWKQGDGAYDRAMRELLDLGDRYLSRGRYVMRANGDRMSEQYGRDNFRATGARDLTWSYASLLEAMRLRRTLG